MANRRDGFQPPKTPVKVHCLHCGGRYMSNEMKWEVRWSGANPIPLWWCKDTDCDGAGFEFDIYPEGEMEG